MNTTALTDSQREQQRSALELRKEQLLEELDAVQRDTLAAASAASRGLTRNKVMKCDSMAKMEPLQLRLKNE